jgi:hypothetical protein
MFRRVVAVVLVLHGFAHVVGFFAAFRLGDFATRSVDTTLLWGRIDIGLVVTQAMGFGWLLLAAAFVGVAFAIWHATRTAVLDLVVVTLVSLAFTVLASPTAIVGLGLNVAILAGLLVYEAMFGRKVSRGLPSRSGPSLPTR